MNSKYLVTFLLLLLVSGVTAKPLPLMTFAKKTEFEMIKISPDGKHFAAKVPTGNKTVLVILDIGSMKSVGVFEFGPNQHIDEFAWVNNERLVYTRNIKEAWQEQSTTYGQIYSGNIDGSKNIIAFGYNGGRQVHSRLDSHQGSEDSWGKIVHMLPDDPKHILIEARSMYNDYDTSVRIIKLNVYSAKKRKVAKTPFGNMRVIYSSIGKPVIAGGIDPKGITRNYFYREGDWMEITKDSPLYGMTPLSLNNAGSKLYLSSYVDQGTETLFEYTFTNKKLNKIFYHETSDILYLIRNPQTGIVVGVEIMPGYFEYHYVDKENKFAIEHAKLAKTFSGNDIQITSTTKNQKMMVVLVESDKNAGDYYLYNKEKSSISYLLSKKSWIDPELMSIRKPIQFKARDGKTIHGYLTLPLDTIQAVPLVTYVHGGPYGARDYWWYDADAQMLANNGYAVLQVNYRGSSGYGKNYEEIAYQKRSTLIQHDIIDGTKWALSLEQIIEKKLVLWEAALVVIRH